MAKVWLITGSARGLGRSITEAVLAAGHKVAAAARNLSGLQELIAQYGDRIFPVQLDVTDYKRVREAVAEVAAHFGSIDVLVNNAGFGITGASEAFTDEQVRSQLETNLYGVIEMTRAVLPFMRQQRSGRILQISSIGGRSGNPGLTIYQAAKFGVSGYTEALAKEVLPLNIRVTSVEPGGFSTDWAGASMSFAPWVEGYEQTADWVANYLKADTFEAMGDPAKAAKVLLELVEHPAPPVHLVLGSDAAGILQQADADRKAEFEQWLPVSTSTDHDAAKSFVDSDAGKALQAMKGN